MPRHRFAPAFVLLSLSLFALPVTGFGATFYVDNQNPAASDAGPGTLATPYRTISAAVSQQGGSGTTILVRPGTYAEQVTVGASGVSGSPFVIEAQGVVTLDAVGQPYGFRLSGRSWVTIRGFRVTRATDKGVYASSSSNWVTIQNCVVTNCATKGIQLSTSSNGLIQGNEVAYNGDHGIYLSSGVTATVLRGNYSHHNARPDVRAANGIQLNGSSGNRIENNRVGNNQDTGLQINTSSNNNVCVQNVSWANGDHGFDHLSSSGNVHIGDVAYGNYKDGFSFEGNAPGGALYNCIGVNNGTTTSEFNLWVDDQSSAGFVSDYNVFWNSTGQSPIKYRTTIYSTITAFTGATGQDSHSIQADPRFVNGAAADFHLRSDSPAIDAANSGAPQWSALDAEGKSRYDVATKANTGAGPVAYADRGAHEFLGEVVGTDQPPSVACPASVTVNEGVLLSVAVSASDPDGDPILSLTADLSGLPTGNNATFTPGLGNTTGTFQWTPGSTHGGTYSVTFTAANALSGSRTMMITVVDLDRAPVVNAPGTIKTTVGAQAVVNVTASDVDGDAITSLTANLSSLPAGNNATFTVNGTNTAGTLRWTPAVGQTGSYNITFTASNLLSASKITRISVRKNGLGLAAEADGTPLELGLSSPTPNPSRGRLMLELSLPSDERVAWGVYDLQGREVWSEASQRSAGHHVLEWNGQDRRAGRASAGLYFVRVRVGATEFTRRFVRM